MYIDFSRAVQRVLGLFGFVVMIFGVILYSFSGTLAAQQVGGLTAIFGLLFLWFSIWLGRSAPPASRNRQPGPNVVASEQPAPRRQRPY